ncbi:MAG: hypothetical protein GC190_09085 [Alphaproteobacteria bacterium]|nr:hypothetical protein [Alphaproteobacteria bacterium]
MSEQEARYEALLFDPIARPTIPIISVVAAIGVATFLVWSNLFLPLITFVAIIPALLLPLLVERGVWIVDRNGVRVKLRPVIPLLPERSESASWSQIDSYRLEEGDWVPRYLKILRGQKTLMTVYEAPNDDAKKAAFTEFARVFEHMAAERKVRRS